MCIQNCLSVNRSACGLNRRHADQGLPGPDDRPDRCLHAPRRCWSELWCSWPPGVVLLVLRASLNARPRRAGGRGCGQRAHSLLYRAESITHAPRTKRRLSFSQSWHTWTAQAYPAKAKSPTASSPSPDELDRRRSWLTTRRTCIQRRANGCFVRSNGDAMRPRAEKKARKKQQQHQQHHHHHHQTGTRAASDCRGLLRAGHRRAYQLQTSSCGPVPHCSLFCCFFGFLPDELLLGDDQTFNGSSSLLAIAHEARS